MEFKHPLILPLCELQQHVFLPFHFGKLLGFGNLLLDEGLEDLLVCFLVLPVLSLRHGVFGLLQVFRIFALQASVELQLPVECS